MSNPDCPIWTDVEKRRFKCNNPKCTFEIISSYASPALPDSDCPLCRWHDSVIDIGTAEHD